MPTHLQIFLIISVTKIFKYELVFQTLTTFFWKINSMAATSSKQLKDICVLSRFHYGKYKDFVQAAIDLGRTIAERKLHLVYGGGEWELSKLVSETFFTRGNQVLGIIPKAIKPLVCLSGLKYKLYNPKGGWIGLLKIYAIQFAQQFNLLPWSNQNNKFIQT